MSKTSLDSAFPISTLRMARSSAAAPELSFKEIAEWFNQQEGSTHEHRLLVSASACANMGVLENIKEAFALGDGWTYSHYEEYPCDLFPTIYMHQQDAHPSYRTGALKMMFEHEDGATRHVLSLTIFYNDGDNNLAVRTLAYAPFSINSAWLAFEKECRRVENSAVQYRGKVFVVGGTETTFDTHIQLEDVYLPQTLKDELLFDIQAFFERGVDIYKRLNIKPFRKLMLAGVPGTGKTMLCSAIAHWALEQGMFVVYVSGSSNGYGARFWKVVSALDMAATSETRTLVIVEELDAFMGDEESKAELLNVLDGMESPSNPLGTIMIATTNHPEKIDERVLKRPGRLDRVFIIPEMEDRDSTERMLRDYMGDLWQDDHKDFVPQLLGKPGAFIREVALYALTRAAYRGDERISLELLQQSLDTLLQQIEAKDDFLIAHKKDGLGFASGKRGKRAKDSLFE
jgi:archaellum biogenesis ATPase FlaH